MEKTRILIADDEPSVRLTVKRMLEKDYTVLEAENGEEAVAVAREQKPALVLMDLIMPKMDGYTACHIIKTDPATMNIAVIILSALGHELNRMVADEMGADAYMTKPFTRQELTDNITPVIRKTF
jgi:CheY-like chemotaxis protein